MSEQSDVQQFLNGLLMTDQTALRFLYQAVFPGAAVPQLEQIVVELTQHVQDHQASIPANLLRQLGAPSSLATHVLAHIIGLGGFYQDSDIAEPLGVILRQLTYVAAHPAAVRALAMATGSRAARMLSDILWSAPIQQWHVREPAILREMGRLGNRGSMDDLIRALAVPYDTPRHAAAEALIHFGEDALPSLLPLARSTANLDQTAGAAEALGLIGDARAVPVLQQAAQMHDPKVSVHAAVALARLGSSDAEARLHDLARHKEIYVRARAMGALAIVGEQDDLSSATIAVLLGGLQDPQPEVRTAAAYALGRLKQASAATSISQILNNEVSPLVRVAMVRALGQLAQPGSLPTLLQRLRYDSVSVQVEVLDALARFIDPAIAEHIVPFRNATDPKLVSAANRALRRLLHKPFAWPDPAPLESTEPIFIALFNLAGARERFLPPPPPPADPSFFDRLFGSKPPEPPPPPKPIGRMILTPDRLSIELNAAEQNNWAGGSIDWSKRFTVQITREPVSEAGSQSEGPNDIGVHFVLRQREGDIGANFQTAAVSLWCARSEIVGQFPAQSSHLPCLDPHGAAPFLAALLWYTEVHGNPIRARKRVPQRG